MEYDGRDFEPATALTRALTELRIVQRRRQKRKMIDISTIGDGEATMVYANVSKIYKGTVTVVRIQDNFQVEVVSCGKRHVIVPWEKVRSCSVQKETVTLQLDMDYEWEKCIFKFHDNAQADVLKSKLPPIIKPISADHNSTDSSDTDYNDSGNEKTQEYKNYSFNSDTPLDELQEL